MNRPADARHAAERQAAHEIAADLALLDAVERGAGAGLRVWTCEFHTVVLGISQQPEHEVFTEVCRERGIPVLKRPSGGGAVLIGPGTLQYAFALPYSLAPELRDIRASKSFCNRLALAALAAASTRPVALAEDESGDLVAGGRKVAGLALKRRRSAMLLHATLLCEADLDLIGRVLRHPSREPSYRAGRPHGDFLANVGPVDPARFEREALRLVAELGGQL